MSKPIPLLDGSNFETWKYDLINLLRAKALLKYVDGTAQPLPTTATPKDIERREENEGRALGYIMAHIDDKLKTSVRSIERPSEIWHKLAEIHEPVTRQQRMRLLTKLWSMSYEKGLPMGSWVAQVMEVVKELRNAKVDISEETICYIVIRSLPKDYEICVHNICELDDADFCLVEIERRLIAQEGRLAETTNGATNWLGQDNSPNKNQRGRGRGRGRGKPRGGRGGNRDAVNWNKPEKPRDKSNATCYRCGETGHFASACMAAQPKRINRGTSDRGGGQPKSQRAHTTYEDEYEEIVDMMFSMFTCNAGTLPKLELTEEPAGMAYEQYTIGSEPPHDYNKALKENFSVPIELILGKVPKTGANFSLDETSAFSITHNNLWLMDSGASSHFCNNKAMFRELVLSKSKAKTTGHGGSLAIEGYGTVDLHIANKKIDLRNVCYAPNARVNLISEARIDKSGYVQIKNKGVHRVMNNACEFIFDARLTHNFYVVDVKNNTTLSDSGHLQKIGAMATIKENQMGEMKLQNTLPKTDGVDTGVIKEEQCHQAETKTHAPTRGDYKLWHARLGHVHEALVKYVSGKEIIRGMPDKLTSRENNTCEPCRQGKATQAHFRPLTRLTSNKTLELLHMDVWGPTASKTASGKQYFLSVIDDYTRYTTVFLLEKKSEVFDIFQKCITRMEREQNAKVIDIRTDNGMEFCHREFTEYCTKLGIHHQRTNVYTPQQDGVAERFNRTIIEQCRTMNRAAGLAKSFWGEAIQTATYIRNHLPTAHYKDITPREMWRGEKPMVKHFRVYGCAAYVHVPKAKRDKLDNSAEKGIFLGYSFTTRGYRILLLESEKIVESK